MTEHNGQTTAVDAETYSLLPDDLLTFDELAAKLKIGAADGAAATTPLIAPGIAGIRHHLQKGQMNCRIDD